MKFYINKIILWLKNGEKKELEFKNNKVNVITGNSDTGKSSILEIIDYCFFGSKSGIPTEHIGENVAWYGLNICINEKCYTIARGEKLENNFSSLYYFSGSGEIPDLPHASIGEDSLKAIIQQEFGITDKVVFPFGGRYIKQNTKISFRYFWMFNTQSGDVITHSQTYFDKQHEERYREALPRIFDLATGISTLENIALADKIDKLEKQINKLEKKEQVEINEEEKRYDKILDLIKKAKKYKLIPQQLNDYEKDYNNLLSIIKNNRLNLVEFPEEELLDNLRNERQRIIIQIKKLERFSGRYKKYKKQLSKDADSLKPVEYLKQYINSSSSDEYISFFKMLESNLLEIKKSIRTKMPFEIDVANKLEKLRNKLKDIEKEINQFPERNNEPLSDKDRYIALGEIKSELNKIINAPTVKLSISEKISNKKNDLEMAKKNFTPSNENRVNTINALNDYIYTYMQSAVDVFGTYSEYKPAFDYKLKKLNLRRSKSAICAGHTSSSVDLFRHICLFLGLHEMIMNKEIPYVAPFLILDQPTRPYFNIAQPVDYKESKNHTLGKDDWTKVRRIFLMLDKFIKSVITNNKEMQVIVLEHVSIEAWKNCNHIYLVEEFDGVNNALIPPK